MNMKQTTQKKSEPKCKEVLNRDEMNEEPNETARRIKRLKLLFRCY